MAADYCLNHLLGSLGYVFFLSKLNLMESQRNRLHIALLALSRASSQEGAPVWCSHWPTPFQALLFLR